MKRIELSRYQLTGIIWNLQEGEHIVSTIGVV